MIKINLHIFSIGVLLMWLLLVRQVGAQEQIYRLVDVDYQLQSRGWFLSGKTQKGQLMQRIRVREGMTFTSLEDLDEASRFWQNELNQFRIFMGNAKVSYTLGEELDGEIPVYLTIFVEEGVNVTGFPSFKITSDAGTSIGLRARHYNFMGTMEPLFLSTSYRKNDYGQHYVDNSIDFSSLFNIQDHYYRLSVSMGGGYQHPLDRGYTLFRGGLSFGSFWIFGSIQRPVAYLDFNVGQSVSILGQIALEQPADVSRVYDTHYFNSNARVGGWVNIMAAPWIKNAWLRYNISAGTSINYTFVREVEEYRRGLDFFTNHSFSYGEVELLASNFKRGYMLSLYNNNNFNVFRMNQYGLMWKDAPANKSGYQPTFGTEARVYVPFLDRVALNARIGIEYQPWQREKADYFVRDNWAEKVRGIRNEAMRGNGLFYWNFEFESNVWMWRLAKIFNVHGVLFFDGGMMHSSLVGNEGWQEPFAGMGVEVRLVPLSSRNLTTRISFGLNINRWFGWEMRGSLFELFIGNELHF